MKTIVMSINLKHKTLDKCLGNNFTLKDIINIVTHSYNKDNYEEAINLLASIENHLHAKVNDLTNFRYKLEKEYFDISEAEKTKENVTKIEKILKNKF